MTTLAFLAAFGAVIVVTAEYVRCQADRDLAAKDRRIRELEEDLAHANRENLRVVEHW